MYGIWSESKSENIWRTYYKVYKGVRCVMAKRRGNMICTSECSGCVHSDISKENVNKQFHCDAKNKDYFYGQYVPCDYKELRKDGT